MGFLSAATCVGFVRRPMGLRASLLAAALLCGPAAHAEDAPSFAELIGSASNAPSQVQSAAELAAAKGRRTQAGVWANPEVEIALDGYGNSNPRIAEQKETTFSVAQTLPLGGKREARVAAAQAEVEAAQARLKLSRTDFAAKLAQSYAEAEAASRRVRIAEDGLAAAETDARAARLLVDAGKEAQLRSLQGDAEVERARAELAAARAAEATAFARLSALIGAEKPYDRIVVSLLDAPLSAPVVADGAASAAVEAARADQAAAEARVRSARAEAFPDVKVSAGVRRYDNLGGSALLAGVSLPFPLFDRNRGGIATARAELTGAEAKLRQTELDLTADRRAARADATSADAQLTAAVAGEKASAEAYRLARIGYQAGRVPLLEVAAARRALVDAQSRTVDARLARVKAQAELARLDGRIPFGS
jgi:cobalt-zinc-cadmium efflux system outer membrane protein